MPQDHSELGVTPDPLTCMTHAYLYPYFLSCPPEPKIIEPCRYRGTRLVSAAQTATISRV